MRRYIGLLKISLTVTVVIVLGGAGYINVSGLSYSKGVGVGFTFKPTIGVTISSDQLVISDLTPGIAAQDSNVITVGVSTNATYGYNLSATVGDSANATTSLVNHIDSNNPSNNPSFTSLSSTASALSDIANNKWGYSYCVAGCSSANSWVSGDQGSTSVGYAGLPLYTNAGVQLISANSNTNDSVQFKIAAKAGSSQASGEYTNVVNFTAVSNVIPTSLMDAFIASGAEQLDGYYKMQDMTSNICDAVDSSLIPSELQLIDERDKKVYWVAKLADGNCWMTQNLDHDIVTTTNYYTYANTDIGHGTTPNSSATWTAGRATYASNDDTWGQYGSHLKLESKDVGDLCWSGDIEDETPVGCSQNGSHYHLGNYYNWAAAVAMNDSSDYIQQNLDVDQSICPAGWRLPLSGSKTFTKSFIYMLSRYNYANNEMSAPHAYEAPLYFAYSGYYAQDYLSLSSVGTLYSVGLDGKYQSSVVYDSTESYFSYFSSTDYVDPVNYDSIIGDGHSVRCVAR